jgi:hypothetical protein
MSHIDWDGGLVGPIRQEMVPGHKTKTAVQKYRPEADKSTFYITKSQIGKLLWIDERDEEDEFDSMLTGMMNVNLE